MLATGCILRDVKDKADYVAEVRVGAVGTDRNEMMFGVPSVSLPVPVAVTGVPTSIPEMKLANKTKQRAVVKLAVFAYNVETGRPVWQSGTFPVESTAKDVWIAGAGPFQSGTIYDKTVFGGDEIDIPLIDFQKRESSPVLAVADDAFFVDEPAEEEEPPKEAVAAASASPSLASPPPAQTVQAQSKSPPSAPDKSKTTTVDPKIVPASNDAPPGDEPKDSASPMPTPEKSQHPDGNPSLPDGVPPDGAPSALKPLDSASAITLRIPSPTETRGKAPQNDAPEAPLPPGAEDSRPSPPRLLNLDGIKPSPMRLPESTQAKPGHILGLPPLPPSEPSHLDRAPASLTGDSVST